MNFDLNQPICRASDPIESYQAADAAKTLILSHERKILLVLGVRGPMGVDGIAARCNLPGHAVGKRMKALLDNDLVKLTGRVVKSASGRNECEWVVR